MVGQAELRYPPCKPQPDPERGHISQGMHILLTRPFLSMVCPMSASVTNPSWPPAAPTIPPGWDTTPCLPEPGSTPGNQESERRPQDNKTNLNPPKANAAPGNGCRAAAQLWGLCSASSGSLCLLDASPRDNSPAGAGF